MVSRFNGNLRVSIRRSYFAGDQFASRVSFYLSGELRSGSAPGSTAVFFGSWNYQIRMLGCTANQIISRLLPTWGKDLRVAFFGGLNMLKRVEDPLRASGSRVRVASLLDLAGMKMRVIQMRASWKDYVDIHALVDHGIDVPTGLAAARAIDARFAQELSLRALQFFGDGNLSRVPAKARRDLARWARGVDPANLPRLSARGDLSLGGLDC